MATIDSMIEGYERTVRSLTEKRDTAMAEVDAFVSLAEREHRDNTAKEQVRIDQLFKVMDSTRDSIREANNKLAGAEKVRDEELETTKRMSDIRPTHTISPSNGLVVTDRSPEPAPWRYANTGDSAVVSRDQSFTDHPVVKAEIERNSERDRMALATYGNFGQFVRATTTSSASAIVPTVWSGDIIDKARNASVCFEAGASLVPMDAKVVQLGRLTTDPTAAYKAESDPVSASDPGVDYIQLTAHSLSALVVVSVEYLQDAVDASDVVTNALAKAMALELDKATLFGQIITAGNAEGVNLPAPYPKGLLKNLLDNASGQVLGSAADGTAQTAATPFTELLNLYYTVVRKNERVTGMVSNDALVQQYDMMVDAQYRSLELPPRLANVPWLTTNAVPSFTRGSMTGRATDVFLGDWSQMLIGQRMGMEIKVLTERYAENGQVGLLAYTRNDVAVARPNAFACFRYLQGAA